MKHINKYQDHVSERAIITRKGKKVYADDKLFKDVDFNELDDNSVFFYNEDQNFFFSAGKFWLYIISDPKWIEDYKNGESDMLLFPPRTRGNMFSVAPITDIWKKKHNRDVKNADLIIGIVEGFHDQEKNEVYIEMMSVRPGYKLNRVNAKMMDILVNHEKLKEAKLLWEDPTADGLEFIKKYSGEDANFHWTIRSRPKNWKTLYPAQSEEPIKK